MSLLRISSIVHGDLDDEDDDGDDDDDDEDDDEQVAYSSNYLSTSTNYRCHV